MFSRPASWSLGVLAPILTLIACSEEVPSPPGGGGADASTTATCSATIPCPSGEQCVSGLCEAVESDGGLPDAQVGPEARLQVCTPDGCVDPYKLDFGGSRVGAVTSRTLVLRSVGEKEVTVRNVSILESGSEFTADPQGELNITLAPNEELTIRVGHTARDGLADEGTLQIFSDADRSRILVSLSTEYKGVPSIAVTDVPASNLPTSVIDFGNVRSGEPESRTVFIKNKDPILDGSVLTISEIQLNAAASAAFSLMVDRPVPAFLNQFNGGCVSDANCDVAGGESCDVPLGVCRDASGVVRDMVSVEVRFTGTAEGLIEGQLLILSNDANTPNTLTTILVRANVTSAALDIAPDPIRFNETFIGFPDRQTVTLTNSGTADLQIQGISLAETSTFSLSGVPTFPRTLATQGNLTFEVVFAPQVQGAFETTLEVRSSDPSLPSQTVLVSGNAFIAPELQIDPPSVDFGNTHIAVAGQPSKSTVVTVRNVGGHELRIPSVTMQAGSPVGFSVDPTSLTPIPAGGQAQFNVRYGPPNPSFPNVEHGSIVLTTNDPRRRPTASISVDGRGINPNALVFANEHVDFNQVSTNPAGAIYEGQVLSTQRTLANGGTGPLTVTEVGFLGDTRGVFAFSGLPAVPFEVAQGQNVTVTITYNSNAAGADSASLRFITDDLDRPGGLVVVTVAGATSLCPSLTGAAGRANPAGVCSYTCLMGYTDLNGDLNTAGSNGCEYQCTFVTDDDPPDDGYADLDCDGVDGNADQSIFVSPNGADGNPGTRALPKRTLSSALPVAGASGLDVLVAGGSYNEAQTLTLVNGVSIHGGYLQNGSDWSRRSLGSISEVVVAAAKAVQANNINQVTVIDHMKFVGADGVNAGDSAYGVFATNSNGLLIRRSTIVAGRGRDGVAGGSVGGQAANGLAGNPGQPGCEDSGGFCSSCGQPQGGAGGRNPGGATCSRPGGAGGVPGKGGGGGGAGQPGTGGTPGGQGCPSGQGNWNPPQSPYWGVFGASGDPGANGNPGAPAYGAGGYAPASGTSGGVGADGNGGGGGGGGGGGNNDCDSFGGAGGGGGGGGCGGQGAEGGSSAGGSFAVYLWSSNVLIELSDLRTGGGGTGGSGGSGQLGGNGGAGGRGDQPGAGNGYGGGDEQDDASNGARGGDGGSGGSGGHGGGGAGGASVGILAAGGSNPIVNLNTYALGGAGVGGSSSGNSGPSGERFEFGAR